MEADEYTPSAIGRFEVRARLGQGLHGEVFLAHDPHLERDVAIKLLHRRSSAGSQDGIPDEARILAHLRHPNIVSVFEAGVHGGEAFYVMEYVRGTTLREVLLREHRLPREEALRIMAPVLAGMAHAHAAGVSHLDLSPANVLLDRNGVPRLMDFGLSRRADRAAETSEMLVGTPRYMAPEHFEFSGLHPYTDVYALGLMLFEMLTGMPVVQADRIEDVARIVCDTEPDWTLLRASNVDGPLEAVIRGALAKRPEARYTDAAAMLAGLGPMAPEAPAGDRHATSRSATSCSSSPTPPTTAPAGAMSPTSPTPSGCSASSACALPATASCTSRTSPARGPTRRCWTRSSPPSPAA